ncbi:hypothetical protein C8Q72DRAFT_806899 [Fomitopsis betulina]|nr:hypothetical protein C8Q72DRAFT_806899 [Fomitopsis betulina]
MLARPSHRAASSNQLYFLGPRLLCRAKNTSATRRRVAATPDVRPSTSRLLPTVPPLDPAQVISRLDHQLQKSDAQPYDGLTTFEAHVFNEAVFLLRQIAETGNVHKAYHIWRTMKDRNMLRFLGPIHHNMISRFVVTACEKSPAPSAWSEQETRMLPEFAVFAAAEGSTEGLKQCMVAYIRENNPNAVIDLFQQYCLSLEMKTTLPDADQLDSRDAPAAGARGPPAAEDVPSPAFFPIRHDILLAVVTAYAMLNSFSGALQTLLRSDGRIPSRFISPWIEELGGTIPGEPLAQFTARLDVARLLARPASLSRHLNNLRRDRSMSSLIALYNRIVGGLKGPRPWLTLPQSQQTSDGLVVVPDLTWPTFITAFMCCRRTDLAKDLWNHVLRLGIRPPVEMWTALIRGYGQLKQPDDALNTWDVMLQQGIRPDALAYQSLIYALYHASRIDDALERFREFQRERSRMSVQPEEATVLVVYNALLHGLLFHDKEKEARAVLEEMRTQGPTPDIVTYNTFLRWYARKDQLKSLAEVLQMLEPTGLKGDVYTFSIVLSALMKVREDAPQIMLSLMERHGVQPNTATMTSIIDQQVRTQTETDFRSALDLLSRMERGDLKGAEPNEVTYTAMLTGIHRNTQFERNVVEEYRTMIWKRMQDRGIKPLRATYNLLIKSSFDNPDSEGVQWAMKYYRDMMKRGLFITTDTWYILLAGLLRRKEFALANEVVKDIRDQDFVPPAALAEVEGVMTYCLR